ADRRRTRGGEGLHRQSERSPDGAGGRGLGIGERERIPAPEVNSRTSAASISKLKSVAILAHRLVLHGDAASQTYRGTQLAAKSPRRKLCRERPTDTPNPTPPV